MLYRLPLTPPGAAAAGQPLPPAPVALGAAAPPLRPSPAPEMPCMKVKPSAQTTEGLSEGHHTLHCTIGRLQHLPKCIIINSQSTESDHSRLQVRAGDVGPVRRPADHSRAPCMARGCANAVSFPLAAALLLRGAVGCGVGRRRKGATQCWLLRHGGDGPGPSSGGRRGVARPWRGSGGCAPG